MITILFLAANPTDTARLRLDAESHAIEIALREARVPRSLPPGKALCGARRRSARSCYCDTSPTSYTSAVTGHRQRYPIGRRYRPGQASSGASSCPLLAAAGRQVRCAVLNACYSHSQASALVEQIGCAIGMPSEVGDHAAIAFAAAFYQALGYGQDIKTAFDLGCVQTSLAGADDDEQPHLETRDNAAAALRFVQRRLTDWLIRSKQSLARNAQASVPRSPAAPWAKSSTSTPWKVD